MRPLIFAASYLSFAFANSAAAAELGGGLVPDWLRGDWVMTKVYEGNVPYPEPAAEPKVRFIGQTMTAEAGKLSLSGEICADATVQEASATFRKLLLHGIAGSKPRWLGIADRPGYIKYLDITCGRSLIDDASGVSERYIGKPIKWQVLRRDGDTIEMPFFAGSFLVLRRQKPIS